MSQIKIPNDNKSPGENAHVHLRATGWKCTQHELLHSNQPDFKLWVIMRDKNKKVKPTVPFGRCPKVLANRFVANAQGFQVLLWSCGSSIRDTAPCILWYSLNSTRHLISFFYLQKKTEANRNEFNSLQSFPTNSNSPAFRSQIVSITMAVAGAVPAGSCLSTLLQVHI